MERTLKHKMSMPKTNVPEIITPTKTTLSTLSKWIPLLCAGAAAGVGGLGAVAALVRRGAVVAAAVVPVRARGALARHLLLLRRRRRRERGGREDEDEGGLRHFAHVEVAPDVTVGCRATSAIRKV